jgi:hypothetical protein
LIQRDAEIAEILMKGLGFANKQIAHITLTRPLPGDIELYADSGRPQLERIVELFTEFDRAVDRRLLPDWWPEWFRGSQVGATTVRGRALGSRRATQG